MKILIINGANLNKLGVRDKSHYGSLTLKTIQKLIQKEFPKIEFNFFQSNIEGEIVDVIQKAEKKYNGIIINPGGFAHTSVVIRDALEDIKIPKIEVHLSQINKRESFRQVLITATACDGMISGLKEKSYIAAVYIIIKLINS
jgi:3-dehydroquinate dehydratase-2